MQLRVPALRPAPEDGADRGCPLPGGVFPSLGWESHLPGSQGGRHSGKQRSYPTGSPVQGCRRWGRGSVSGPSIQGRLPPGDLNSYSVLAPRGPPALIPPPLLTQNRRPRAGALPQVALACGQGRRRRSPPLSRQPVRAGRALHPRRLASSIPSCSAAQGQDGC